MEAELGEEPIYCKTHDDDILYSGSEDDYYEDAEARRMRIEAKAIQYLNGNVPYILSARLRGPFDAKSWDNPWKSKRAQRRAACQRGSQTRPSPNTAKSSRGLASAKATCNDDLPDTQRTSLFPLPSPEITNPPSARHNHFLDEEDFSRIKQWRQTVKKVPVVRDPFWSSYQKASQHSPISKKRSGDQDWLHKREPKKRKSEDVRSLSQDQSPSQAAAKTRESQLSDRLADKVVAQSAPGSSTHDTGPAARSGTKAASFDTSRIANMSANSPSALQTARVSSLTENLFDALPLCSSDDEQPMPSDVRSRPTKRSTSRGKSVPRTQGEVQGPTTRSRSSQATQAEVTGPTTRSRASQAHKTRVSMGMTTRDPTPQTVRRQKNQSTKNPDLAKNAARHGPSQKPQKKLLANTTVGASQRDDSFYFHPAKSKQQSRPQELLSADHMDDTTLTLPRSLPAPAVAQEAGDGQANDKTHEEDTSEPAPASPNNQMLIDLNDDQDAPVEATTAALDGKAIAAEDNVHLPHELHLANETQHRSQQNTAHQSHSDPPTICIGIGTSQAKQHCTQELSPVSMQSRPQATGSASESTAPASAYRPDAHDADTSNPDWSTYVNTQDVSTGLEQTSSAVGDADSPAEDAVDPDDPEWTTYVNTQDTGRPGTETEVQVVAQGPGDPSDPEWSTFASTQDLSTTQAQRDETSEVNDEPAATHEAEAANIDAETDSHSELSFLSVSSEADAEHTGNTSSEPVRVDALPVEAKESQDTVGGIIDAYADSDHPMDDLEGFPKSQDPIVQTESLATPEQPHIEDSIQSEHQLAEDDKAQSPAIQGGPALIAQIMSSPTTMDPTQTPADPAPNPPRVSTESSIAPANPSAIDFDGTTVSLASSHVPVEQSSVQSPVERSTVQSPWVKDAPELSISAGLPTNTPPVDDVSRLSSLAGKALVFPPAPQTPWLGDRLPSPNFSLSVKRFSDFMKPSPEKRRLLAHGSILRSSGKDSTSRVLFGTPMPVKPKRHVQFAPLPGEDGILLTTAESKSEEKQVAEEVSYFDAKGTKTASIRITRSHMRAASPPPADLNIADAADLADRDDKFASHFEAVSKRAKDRPRKKQRLLPSESQQTDGSQAVDAMAEAFIQASQTRQKSLELVEAMEERTRLSEPSPEQMVGPVVMPPFDEQTANLDEPVDDVSAVLDNIDDFLDNSWGFNTSMDLEEEEAPAKQRTSNLPSRFENVGDPILAMHANVWAD